MTTFTIDIDNNITAFAGPDQAEAVIATGAQPFASSEELTQLAAGWPTERLLAIWNSLPGVTPAKGFKTSKVAATKIWGRIQSMAEPEKPIDAAPKAERKPKGGAQGAKGAPAKGKATKKATPAKKSRLRRGLGCRADRDRAALSSGWSLLRRVGRRRDQGTSCRQSSCGHRIWLRRQDRGNQDSRQV